MTAKTTPFWIKPALAVAGLLLVLLLVPPLVGVKAVYLATDQLVFVLVAGVILLAAYIRRKEHLRQPWLQVFRQRRAMVALVVLCSFVIIGLLDSIHFRKPLPATTPQAQVHYSVEVLSVLDALLVTLREREEKSYSAPFAAHLFAKESITLADGQMVREVERCAAGQAQVIGVNRLGGDILEPQRVLSALRAAAGKPDKAEANIS